MRKHSIREEAPGIFGRFFCGAHGVNPRVVPIMKEDGVDISARLVEMIA